MGYISYQHQSWYILVLTPHNQHKTFYNGFYITACTDGFLYYTNSPSMIAPHPLWVSYGGTITKEDSELFTINHLINPRVHLHCSCKCSRYNVSNASASQSGIQTQGLSNSSETFLTFKMSRYISDLAKSINASFDLDLYLWPWPLTLKFNYQYDTPPLDFLWSNYYQGRFLVVHHQFTVHASAAGAMYIFVKPRTFPTQVQHFFNLWSENNHTHIRNNNGRPANIYWQKNCMDA